MHNYKWSRKSVLAAIADIEFYINFAKATDSELFRVNNYKLAQRCIQDLLDVRGLLIMENKISKRNIAKLWKLQAKADPNYYPRCGECSRKCHETELTPADGCSLIDNHIEGK